MTLSLNANNEGLPPPNSYNEETQNEMLKDPPKHPEMEQYEYHNEQYEYNDQYEYHDLPKIKSFRSPDNNTEYKVATEKVKLKKGFPVEVYSNSSQKWHKGKIIKVQAKKGLICIQYGKGLKKWLEATSKQFRPRMEQKFNIIPKLKKTQSIALQQANPVKLKLRIGCRVEVFSVSNNRWIDGKLTGLKKGLICVAYGEDLSTEKWLRENSEQFRPKLDMVDEAFVRTKDGSHVQHDYTIDDDEKGGYVPFAPKPGAYMTHSLRREQYQMESIKSIKGINNKRGDLKIKVHGALQLKYNCNFAQVTLSNQSLRTKKVTTDDNPVWKEILRFSNYRPQIGKTAVIEVGNKNILNEKIIGRAEFELPIVFNSQEKMTLDVTDNKKKLCGIVVLEQCVVDKGK